MEEAHRSIREFLKRNALKNRFKPDKEMEPQKDYQEINIYLARNRRLGLPDWSQWVESSSADPACIICKGIGYLREENLEITNPRFGRITKCSCTDAIKVPMDQPDNLD